MTAPIYIPSYGRSKIWTYEEMPKAFKGQCVLVVCREDARALRKTYHDVKLWISEEQGKGAGPVRQAILERCAKAPVCIMLDDDIRFKVGIWEEGKKRFRKGPEQVVQKYLAELIQKTLEAGTGFCSLSTPFFNSYRDVWAMNKRKMASLFINMHSVRVAGSSFTGIPTMEDIKFCLELHSAGYVSWTHTYLAAIDAGQRGGERSPARAENHTVAAHLLAKWYPKYVKLRDASKNKTHMENIGSPIDITFYPHRLWKDVTHDRKARSKEAFGLV